MWLNGPRRDGHVRRGRFRRSDERVSGRGLGPHDHSLPTNLLFLTMEVREGVRQNKDLTRSGNGSLRPRLAVVAKTGVP